MDLLGVMGPPTFDNSIIQKEFRTYTPFVQSFKNNDEIRIVIQNQDLILLPSESYIRCVLNYNVEHVNAKLQNNFLAFMFEEIRYELNGHEIDKVKNPGITTCLKNYCSLTQDESRNLSYAGWFHGIEENHPDVKLKFEICLPLRKLFGFCEDYKKVILGSRHELILIRSRSDNNSVELVANSKFELTLDQVQWKMPIIQVSDVEKYSLMKTINKDQFITIPFRGWLLNEYPTIPTVSKHIWNVKTSTQIEKPRFIIFGLQNAKKNKMEKDSSKFDPCNLGNVRVYLNSHQYPNEEIRFNFQECFSQVYEAYSNFRKVYYGDSISYPLLTMNEFKKQGLVFINCQHQDETIKAGPIDLALHFESFNNEAFKPETTAFCLIIHDKIVQYNPLTNLVETIK